MTKFEYEVLLIEETHKMIENIIDIVSNLVAKLEEVNVNDD